MLNQIVLVGRLVNDPKIEKEGEKETTIIQLAIPRPFKNADGEYETDFIDCILWHQVATTTTEYCKKGDIVGIKGRIQTSPLANDDGEIIGKTTQVIAERVTFLSSKKKEE